MDLRDVTLVNQDAVKVLAGAVPINARLSAAEIDRVLLDAKARGLVRYSSLSKPAVQLPWQLVLGEEPWTFGTTPVQILFMARKRFWLSSIRVARRAGRRASW